jgi:hypothetical protein
MTENDRIVHITLNFADSGIQGIRTGHEEDFWLI